MSDLYTVKWLREEAECALIDGCAVAAGRLNKAADEIERLTEIATTNWDKWQEQTNRIGGLLLRNKTLQAKVDALKKVRDEVFAVMGSVDGSKENIAAWKRLKAALAAEDKPDV